MVAFCSAASGVVKYVTPGLGTSGPVGNGRPHGKVLAPAAWKKLT